MKGENVSFNWLWTQCHFGHKWGKFSSIKVITYTKELMGVDVGKYRCFAQERTCKRCGKIEFKRLGD